MRTLIRGAKIIDGTGKAPMETGEILIENERLIDVSHAPIDTGSDVEIIDVHGKVIVPGLINSHVHILADPSLDASLFVACSESETSTAFRGQKNLQLLLQSGVTYTRDLGGPGLYNIHLRDALNQELIEGAGLLSAAHALTTVGGHIWKISRECSGVEDIKKAVQEQVDAGADCIKIMITGGYSTPGVHPKTLQFTQKEINAAVEASHLAGKKISSHTYGLKAIKMAVAGGIDCIEHCEFFPDEDSLEIDRVLALMATKGTFVVPTISAWFKDFKEEYGADGPIKSEVLARELLRQPDHVRPKHIPREYYTLQQIFDNATRFHRAGVRLAMGTDAGIRGIYFDRHAFEMKCMQHMGMSPMEVIVASTKGGSELLGISDEYGTLEKGKYADLVILNEDPLISFDHIKKIHSIYKKGKLVERA